MSDHLGLIPLGGSVYAHPDLAPYLEPVGNVEPHPDNPRRGEVDVICASLETNGLYRPLVVQKSTRFVLAGNHTLLALLRLGAEQVPVTWVDVDERDAARIILADNRSSDLGGYDVTALAEVMNSLGPDAFVGTGYAEADLDQLLVDLQSAAEVSKNASGYYEAVQEAMGHQTDAEAEWVGMPEYERGDTNAYRQILVSFANAEDVEEFAKRLDMHLTPKTRYLWFPQHERDITIALRYQQEQEQAAVG